MAHGPAVKIILGDSERSELEMRARRRKIGRADAVRAYLIRQGVPGAQLTVRGFGSANPLDSNSTATGRARNRRVELHRQS